MHNVSNDLTDYRHTNRGLRFKNYQSITIFKTKSLQRTTLHYFQIKCNNFDRIQYRSS